jgi:phage host-nuclease inhibitor protein Gam
MNRTKKKVTTLIMQPEVPEYVRRFAAATSKIKAIEAEIELQKQEIVKRYEQRLATLNELRDTCVATLQNFCEYHREDLFKTRKSMELPHGTIGFRTGTPKVEKDKRVTWEAVLEDLKAIDETFVRTKQEPNKDAIIAQRNDDKTMFKLNKIGLHVVQDETFFVEAKEENLVAEP